MKKIFTILIFICICITLTSCDDYSINKLKDYGSIKVLDYKNEVNEEEFVTKIYQYLDTYLIDRHTRDFVYTYDIDTFEQKFNVCMEENIPIGYSSSTTKFDIDNLVYIFDLKNIEDENFKYEYQVQIYNDSIYDIFNYENEKDIISSVNNRVSIIEEDSIFETSYFLETDVVTEAKNYLDYYLNIEDNQITNSFYIDNNVYTFTQVIINTLNHYLVQSDHVNNEQYRILQIVLNETSIEFYFKEFYYFDYGREYVSTALTKLNFHYTGEKGYKAYYRKLSFENVDIPLVDIESLLNNSEQ